MYWLLCIGLLCFTGLSEEQIMPTNVAKTRQKLLGLTPSSSTPMNTWSSYLSSQGFMANGFRPFNNIMGHTVDPPVTVPSEAPLNFPGGRSAGETTSVNDIIPPTLSPEVRKQAQEALAAGMDIAEIAALKDYPPQFLERLEESLTESANAANAIIISSMSQNTANANRQSIAGQQQARHLGMPQFPMNNHFQQPSRTVMEHTIQSRKQVISPLNLVQSRSPLPLITADPSPISSPPPLTGGQMMPSMNQGMPQNHNTASGAVNDNVVSLLKRLSRLWNERQVQAKNGSPEAMNTFNQIDSIIAMLSPQSKKMVMPIISRFMQTQNLNSNDRRLPSDKTLQQTNTVMNRNHNPTKVTSKDQHISDYKADQGINTIMNLRQNKINSLQRGKGTDTNFNQSNKTSTTDAGVKSLASAKQMSQMKQQTLHNTKSGSLSSRTHRQTPSSASNMFNKHSNPGFRSFNNERSRLLQSNHMRQILHNTMVKESGINRANSVTAKDPVVPVPVYPVQDMNVAVQWATTPAQDFETTPTPPSIIDKIPSSHTVNSISSGTSNSISSGTSNSISSGARNHVSSNTVNSLSTDTERSMSSRIVNPVPSRRVNSMSARLVHSARNFLHRQKLGMLPARNFQRMQLSQMLNSGNYRHKQSSGALNAGNYQSQQASNILAAQNVQHKQSPDTLNSGNYQPKQSSNVLNPGDYQQKKSSEKVNSRNYKHTQSPDVLNSGNFQTAQSFEAANAQHIPSSNLETSSPSAVVNAGPRPAQTSTARHSSATVSSIQPTNVAGTLFSAAQEQSPNMGNHIRAHTTTTKQDLVSQGRNLNNVIISSSSSLATSTATSTTDAARNITSSSMAVDLNTMESFAVTETTAAGQPNNLRTKASGTTTLPEKVTKHKPARHASLGLVDGRVIQDTWKAFSKSLREMAAYGNKLLMLTSKIVKSQI